MPKNLCGHLGCQKWKAPNKVYCPKCTITAPTDNKVKAMIVKYIKDKKRSKQNEGR